MYNILIATTDVTISRAANKQQQMEMMMSCMQIISGRRDGRDPRPLRRARPVGRSAQRRRRLSRVQTPARRRRRPTRRPTRPPTRATRFVVARQRTWKSQSASNQVQPGRCAVTLIRHRTSPRARHFRRALVQAESSVALDDRYVGLRDCRKIDAPRGASSQNHEASPFPWTWGSSTQSTPAPSIGHPRPAAGSMPRGRVGAGRRLH